MKNPDSTATGPVPHEMNLREELQSMRRPGVAGKDTRRSFDVHLDNTSVNINDSLLNNDSDNNINNTNKRRRDGILTMQQQRQYVSSSSSFTDTTGRGRGRGRGEVGPPPLSLPQPSDSSKRREHIVTLSVDAHTKRVDRGKILQQVSNTIL